MAKNKVQLTDEYLARGSFYWLLSWDYDALIRESEEQARDFIRLVLDAN